MACPGRLITPAHWSWTDPASSELPIPTVLRLFPVVSSGSLRVPFFGPSNALVVPSISSHTGPAIAHKTLCPTDALFLVTCASRSWTYTLTPSFAMWFMGVLILPSSSFYAGPWVYEDPKTMIPLPSSQDYPF